MSGRPVSGAEASLTGTSLETRTVTESARGNFTPELPLTTGAAAVRAVPSLDSRELEQVILASDWSRYVT